MKNGNVHKTKIEFYVPSDMETMHLFQEEVILFMCKLSRQGITSEVDLGESSHAILHLLKRYSGVFSTRALVKALDSGKSSEQMDALHHLMDGVLMDIRQEKVYSEKDHHFLWSFIEKMYGRAAVEEARDVILNTKDESQLKKEVDMWRSVCWFLIENKVI